MSGTPGIKNNTDAEKANSGLTPILNFTDEPAINDAVKDAKKTHM